jgi:hypothetical protein
MCQIQYFAYLLAYKIYPHVLLSIELISIFVCLHTLYYLRTKIKKTTLDVFLFSLRLYLHTLYYLHTKI